MPGRRIAAALLSTVVVVATVAIINGRPQGRAADPPAARTSSGPATRTADAPATPGRLLGPPPSSAPRSAATGS